MDRRGRVPVRLRCNGSGGVCRGTLQLASVRNRRAVPLGKARVRTIVTSEHSRDDLEACIDAFTAVGRELRLI